MKSLPLHACLAGLLLLACESDSTPTDSGVPSDGADGASDGSDGFPDGTPGDDAGPDAQDGDFEPDPDAGTGDGGGDGDGDGQDEPDAGPPRPVPEKRVVPIYIRATDENPADTERYVATYDAIVEGIRTWYTDQLAEHGNLHFYHEPVRVMQGHYTRAEWDRFGTGGFEYPDGTKTADGGGCSMYYGAEHELRDNGLLAEAGLPPLGTGGVVYYAINGGGTNGSCGAGGYLAASELNLLILAEQNCPTGRKVNGATDCGPVGAIAHEIGHGFGLPHTPDRPNCAGIQSIMQEWWLYDDVGMCGEERTDLVNSGYFFTP